MEYKNNMFKLPVYIPNYNISNNQETEKKTDKKYKTVDYEGIFEYGVYKIFNEKYLDFKDKVFNTIIPRLVRLVEAPSHGKPINEYDPESRGAEAYHNLAKEVIERDGN